MTLVESRADARLPKPKIVCCWSAYFDCWIISYPACWYRNGWHISVASSWSDALPLIRRHLGEIEAEARKCTRRNAA